MEARPHLLRTQILVRQRRYRIFAETVGSFCNGMLLALDQPASMLSVAFVGLKEIRRLNRSYRGRDYPTDVLSFSYGKEEIEGLPFLGEIVIAPEVAYRQAMASRTDPEKEMRMLLLHGLLHLLGYDHETDRGEMRRLQRRLMRRRVFRGPAPLIDMGSRR